jgi:SAM-dependent methyltransferase
VNDPYSGLDNLEVMRQARRYNRFLIETIAAAGAGARRAVDFGAGDGTFAAAMWRRGMQVTCVETDPGLREALVRRGFRCVSSLDGLEEGCFDFAYSTNVLEHIGDDAAALRSLYARLRPGGRLLLYVPAFQLLYSSMDERVGHQRRYRRSGLVELLGAAGFEVASCRYVDSLGFAVSLAFRAIGSSDGRITPGSIRAYDRVFPLSLALDRLLRGRVGKNLVAIARRPLG